MPMKQSWTSMAFVRVASISLTIYKIKEHKVNDLCKYLKINMKILDVNDRTVYLYSYCAALAQLVERSIRNAEVVSSSLTCGTTFFRWLGSCDTSHPISPWINYR